MVICGINSITTDDGLFMKTHGKSFQAFFLSKFMQSDRRNK